jgi:hypothetical protein
MIEQGYLSEECAQCKFRLGFSMRSHNHGFA